MRGDRFVRLQALWYEGVLMEVRGRIHGMHRFIVVQLRWLAVTLLATVVLGVVAAYTSLVQVVTLAAIASGFALGTLVVLVLHSSLDRAWGPDPFLDARAEVWVRGGRLFGSGGALIVVGVVSGQQLIGIVGVVAIGGGLVAVARIERAYRRRVRRDRQLLADQRTPSS